VKIMAGATRSGDDDPAPPSFPRGARAQRALLLRRAANRTSRRILRSLGGEARRVIPAAPPPSAPPLDVPAPDHVIRTPLGRPVEPDVALEGENNRWGGRL
jgi:hypothetical protein